MSKYLSRICFNVLKMNFPFLNPVKSNSGESLFTEFCFLGEETLGCNFPVSSKNYWGESVFQHNGINSQLSALIRVWFPQSWNTEVTTRSGSPYSLYVNPLWRILCQYRSASVLALEEVNNTRKNSWSYVDHVIQLNNFRQIKFWGDSQLKISLLFAD